MDAKPFAFVLMPFDQKFDDIYKLGIQAAASEHGVIAERVDEQIYSESILDRIYRQIRNADFIIADMTGRNPNVFYEVGYAHALGKPCTLLTQSSEDIPFDLKHHRHIVYANSIQVLKKRLSLELEWLKGEVDKTRDDTVSVELKDIGGFLERDTWHITAELSMTLDLHNRGKKRSPDIEAIYIYTVNNWSFRQGEEICAATDSEDGPAAIKTFVKSPFTRLSPGGWAQIRLSGRREVWSKFSGEEEKPEYKMSGPIILDIHTSEGILRRTVNATTDFSDVPF